MFFSHFYKGKQHLWLPDCILGQLSCSKIGSTHLGKNLHIEDQILLEFTPIVNRDKNVIAAVPESVSFHLHRKHEL